MKKTMVSMLCLLLMAALLAGCGSQEVSGDPTPPQTDGTTLPLTTGNSPVPTTPTSSAPAPTEYTLTVEQTGKDNAYYDDTITFVYDLDGNLLQFATGYRIMEYTYDDLGNMTSKTVSVGSGKVESKMEFFYDEAGRLVEASGFGYAEVYTTYKTLYFYDEGGNLIREEEYTNDELQFVMIYRANGDLLEGFSYIAGKSHSVYTYADDGKLLRIQTERDGELSSGSDYFYDDRGNLIREEAFRMSGGERKELTNSYTYDADGRCVRIDLGGYQGEQSSEVYTYDEQGRMLSAVYTDYRGDATYTYWTYHAQTGNVATFRVETNKGLVSELRWDYDAQGNVTGYTQDGAVYLLTYTGQNGDQPEKMRENFLMMLYNYLGITAYTPEYYTRLYR